MQQYKILITELAKNDLRNISLYITYELLNPDASIRTFRGIRKQIDKLVILPERNQLDDDPALRELGVRSTSYKNYKIYYVVDNEILTVTVIRIFHMLEDSHTWLYQVLKL